MQKNMVVCTVVGAIIIACVAGGVGCLLFLLGRLMDAFKSEGVRQILLATPVVLILAYLIGYGWLDHREKTKSVKEGV